MNKRRLVLLTWLLVCGWCVRAYAHDYAMSFLYGGTNAQYINCVQNANGVINSVSPDYFEINEDGTLKEQKIDRSFIAAMHEKGIQVIPFLTNHWARSLGQAALYNADALSEDIARAVYEYDLDGVNIDIENINEKQKDDYTYLVASLRYKIPDKVLSVSVAANPYDWQTGWHGSYDYKRLADNCDYLLVMVCDESYLGSKPGPVASAAFTEKSIEYALKQVPPEKIVLGIPFFGRYWKQGEAIGGHGLTVMDINNLIKRYAHQMVYHDDAQSAQVTLTIAAGDTLPKVWGGRTLEPGVYDIWYDDVQATAYKLGLINRYHLRGSGSWALGQDAEEMWDTYAQYKAGMVESDDVSPAQMPTAEQDTPAQAPTQAPANERALPAQITPAQTAPPQTPSPSGFKRPPVMYRIYPSGYVESPETAHQTEPEPATAYQAVPEPVTAYQAAPEPATAYLAEPESAAAYPIMPEPASSMSATEATEAYPLMPITQTAPSALPTPSTPTTPSAPSAPIPSAYSEEARRLMDKGWLDTYAYDEARYATHGDALAIIMKMASLWPEGKTLGHFADTADHRYGTYIRKARNYGIVSGDSRGRFQPDRLLSRQDLVLYLDRVFDLPDTINFENEIAHDLHKENNAERYYAVQKYLTHGIVMVDTDGNFRPYDMITMGELVQTMQKMEGCGLKELRPLMYDGQKQRQKIMEPR